MAPQTIFSLTSCLAVGLVLACTASFASIADASEISQAPKLVDQVETLNHQEGTNATFTCSIGSGELDGLTFEWRKDDRRITPTTTSNKLRISTLPENFQSILRVIDLKPTDSAVYTCIAKNSFGHDKISTKLNVKVQLKWLVEPQDTEVAVGRQLSIACSASGSPLPTVEWIKVVDGQQQSFASVGPELQFASVSQQDAGHYECRARNGAEKDLVKRIELRVLELCQRGPLSSPAAHRRRRLLFWGAEAGGKSKSTKTTVIAIDGGGAGPGKAHPMPVPWPVVHCHHHHHHLKYIPKPILIHHWVKKKKIPSAQAEHEHDHEQEHESEYEHGHEHHSAAGSELVPSANPSSHHHSYHSAHHANYHDHHDHHNHYRPLASSQQQSPAHDAHRHHHHHHHSHRHHEPSTTLDSKNVGFEDPDLNSSLFAEGGLSDQTLAALATKLAIDSSAKSLAPKKQLLDSFNRRPQQHQMRQVGGAGSGKKLSPAQKLSLGDADSVDSTKNIALANQTDSAAGSQASLPSREQTGTNFEILAQQTATNGGDGNDPNWALDLSSANNREQREATKALEHVSLEQLNRVQTLENLNRHQQQLLLLQQQARPALPQFATNNQQAAAAAAVAALIASASQSSPQQMAPTAMIGQPSLPIGLQRNSPQLMSSMSMANPAIGARMASAMSELHTISVMTRLAAQMAQVEAKRLLAKKQQPRSFSSSLPAGDNRSTKGSHAAAKDLRGRRRPVSSTAKSPAGLLERQKNVLTILGAPLRNLREKRRASLAPAGPQLLTGPINNLIANSSLSSLFSHRHDASGWTPTPPAPTSRQTTRMSSGARLNGISSARNSRQQDPALTRYFVSAQKELPETVGGGAVISNLISGTVLTPATARQHDQLFASASSSSDGFKVLEPPPPASTNSSSSSMLAVATTPVSTAAQNATTGKPDQPPVLSDQRETSKSNQPVRQQQEAKIKSLPMLARQTDSTEKAAEQLHLLSAPMGSELAPSTTMSPEQEDSFYSRQREHLQANRRRQQQQQQQTMANEEPAKTTRNNSLLSNSSNTYNTLSSNVHNSIADPGQPLQTASSTNFSAVADLSGSNLPQINEHIGQSLEDQRIFLGQALFQQQLRAAKQLSSGRQSTLSDSPEQFDPSKGGFSSAEMFGASNSAADEQEQVVPIPSAFLEFPLPPEQWSSEAFKSMNEPNSQSTSDAASEGGQSNEQSSNENDPGTSNSEQQQPQSGASGESSSDSSEPALGQQQLDGTAQQVSELPLDFYGHPAQQKLVLEQLIGGQQSRPAQQAAVAASGGRVQEEAGLFVPLMSQQQQQQQGGYQVIPERSSAQTAANYNRPPPMMSSQPYFYYPRLQQQQQPRYESSPLPMQQQQDQRQQFGQRQPTMANSGVTYYSSAGYTGSGSAPSPVRLRVPQPIYISNYRLPHSGSNHVATYVPAFAISSGGSPTTAATTTLGQPMPAAASSTAGSSLGRPDDYATPAAQYLASPSSVLTGGGHSRPLLVMTMVPSDAPEPASYGTVISGSVVTPPFHSSSQEFASSLVSPASSSALASIGGGGNLVPTLQTATNDFDRARQFRKALGQSAGNAMLTQANLTTMVRLSHQLKNQMKSFQSRLPQMPNIPQPPQLPNLPMPPPGMMQMAGLALPFAMARANRQANRARDQKINSAANNGGSTGGGRRGQGGLVNGIARISGRIFARPRVKPADSEGAGSGQTPGGQSFGKLGWRPLVAGLKNNRLFGVMRAVMDLSLPSDRPPAPLKELTGVVGSKGGFGGGG